VTDRTVVYRLRVEAAQARAQMQAMAATTRKAGVEMGTSISAGAGKASSALDDLGINAGTVALAVGTSVVVATANFEKAMSGVRAATHETAANMNLLRDAALEAGASTSFSATEAAAGIENLAKAGLSTQDILDGGLNGSLDLAAAGGMEVAAAAEAAAGALAQFKLEGDQATHVADLLAAGAGKAQGDVSDMVMALKQAGTVSAQTGLSLEETVAALSAMAEQSLLGSDAGTSFKTMLAALTPNSKKAADAMERYNIHAFDAQGNFVGMTELAGQLQAGLSGLTDEQRAMALETIFGSDAVRAASIIYDNGAEGIANWTAKVDDAGYAAETAAIQMDNLKGDVEQLKGALETAFIEGGDDSQGMLRGLTQAATDAVNLATETEKADGALGGLWDSAMGAVNPLGSLGAAYNGLKGEISGTDEKAKELDSTSKSLTETSGSATGSTSAFASATEGLGGAFDDTAEAMEAAEQAAEDFKDLMDSLNAVLGGRADLRDYEAAIDDFTKKLKENGNTFDTNTEKGRENEAMLDNIAGSALAVAENLSQADRRKFLTGAIKDLRTMGAEMGLPKSQVRDLIELLREAHNADVNPKIDVNTTQSLAKIQAVRNSIENLRDRNLTITTTYKVVRNAADSVPYRGEADGGVLDFYAAGGIREQHVAQIAPAGSWRVWAEPETGGEAYIPLASSKRERSIDIWEEVGQRLGVNFMQFAKGGTTGGKGKKPPKTSLEFVEAFVPGMSAVVAAQFEATQALFAAASDQAAAARNQLEAAEGAEAAAREQKEAAESQLRATEAQRDAFGSQVRGNFERDPFGSGFNAAIRSLTKDTEGATGFEDLLRQLEALGLDGAAYGALAASGDAATARGMLSRGAEGVNLFEGAYGGREAALGSLSTYAADNQFAEAIAQQTAQLAAATAAQDQAAARVQELSGSVWALGENVNALENQLGALTETLQNQSQRPIVVNEARTPMQTAQEIARHERAGV
jgi:TP901 family phage tail tape measure protein